MDDAAAKPKAQPQPARVPAARTLARGGVQRGIGYWMERVVAEAEKTRADFAADPVHDLRVALRRCRSMAESFRAVDPDPAWNKMRKAGKAVFSALGELRDCQVLMEWIAKLRGKDDAAADKLMAYSQSRERELKSAAAEVLAGFDERQWQRWAQTLESRADASPVMKMSSRCWRWRNGRRRGACIRPRFAIAARWRCISSASESNASVMSSKIFCRVTTKCGART